MAFLTLTQQFWSSAYWNKSHILFGMLVCQTVHLLKTDNGLQISPLPIDVTERNIPNLLWGLFGAHWKCNKYIIC